MGRPKKSGSDATPMLSFMADVPDSQAATGSTRLILRAMPPPAVTGAVRGRPPEAQADDRQANLAIVSNDLPRSVMRPALSLHAWRLFLLLCVRATSVGETERIRMKAREIKRLFGLNSHAAYKQIEEAGDELMRTVMVKKEGKVREKFQLVSFARYHDRIGDVELELHPEIVPFIVGLKSHFTRISLSGVLKIHSAPALKFFMLALSWDPRNKGNRTPYHYFTIAAFREWMGFDSKTKGYECDAVLAMVFKRAKEHLDEVGELSFEWEAHKKAEPDPTTGVKRLRVVGWHIYPIANKPKGKRRRKSSKPSTVEPVAPETDCELVIRARAAQAIWDRSSEEDRDGWMSCWSSDRMKPDHQSGLYFGNSLAEILEAGNAGDREMLAAEIARLSGPATQRPTESAPDSTDQEKALPF